MYISALPMEDQPLDMISVVDVGECCLHIFNRPRFYANKTLSLAAVRLTTQEIARAFSKHMFNKKFIHPKVRLLHLNCGD